jgi:hypothetical protein
MIGLDQEINNPWMVGLKKSFRLLGNDGTKKNQL